jgi:molecular chaperone DnaK (HSP70)
MKETAEDFIGQPVKHAVVTCPAYFNDAQVFSQLARPALVPMHFLLLS